MNDAVPGRRTGNWEPVATLLVLSPAIGELLSGSSPPLQFFNPIAFLLLVGLYGCGALLVRETVNRYGLSAVAILLLGAAYGIVEEGLCCKSFFNPNWTDTGYGSVYGRLWDVNWVWAFGLTAYHAVVSITVPIFLTEALFSSRAKFPWLRRRGWVIAGSALSLVTLLGFLTFDNRQFHLMEIKKPLVLAQRLNAPADPLAQFISSDLKPKTRDLIARAVKENTGSMDLRHALQDEMNRLLARPDLYSRERFAGITMNDKLKEQTEKIPSGDKLVQFNRELLERAFPEILARRRVYPFHPAWWLTVGCLLSIVGLVKLALRQTRTPHTNEVLRRPWLSGLGFTAAFVVIGFILPSLAEHGWKIPAGVDCAIWGVIAVLVARKLKRADGSMDRPWSRGLWAIGVITPWVLFAAVLGIFVQIMGAKSFSGMTVVALAFGLAILTLALKWRRRLKSELKLLDPNPAGVQLDFDI